ncbi:hypothetical protein DACRYDRAFT_15677 [Dacryopinax primogenitus]|uniref:Uncharacterized protein n=1 Tax=Dacryopinax primogenitus (strain DJM 731) TaxID=1858805 RepID=M5G2G4_DACPD|nr:uncharacterized protein DACRYDRAFT_15677 [Dacryopinax primogenitus]EJU02405.1 hypothetical protein DACRYDRAFT_15677 [Dacryopinax primogenitus]
MPWNTLHTMKDMDAAQQHRHTRLDTGDEVIPITNDSDNDVFTAPAMASLGKPVHIESHGNHSETKTKTLLNDNIPVLCWAVGHVAALKFQQEDDKWPDQVYLSVDPIVKSNSDCAAQICNMYSKPKQGGSLIPFGTVIASKFQTPFSPLKNKDAQPLEFTAVYDAMHGMKPKKDLRQYSASHLKKGDVVLSKMHIKKRFDCTSCNLGSPKKDWSYTVGFTLHAVYVIEVGSIPKDDDTEVEYDF